MGDLWRLIALAPPALRRAFALAISWTVFATLADIAPLALLNTALASIGRVAGSADRVAPLAAFILAAMSGSDLRLEAPGPADPRFHGSRRGIAPPARDGGHSGPSARHVLELAGFGLALPGSRPCHGWAQ
jgi:hypothetical protein